jgi:hypothetical protein
MDTITVYAVVNEGHELDYITKDGRGIIVASSYWLTEAEAQYAIDRVFENFGSWRPKRRWIEEREITDIDMVSELSHNRPEYATR